MKKLILLLCAVLLIKFGITQNLNNSVYKFKVEYENKNKAKSELHYDDSLKIVFLYGFKNDIISIKAKTIEFQSDTLNAENIYGIGGVLKLAKHDLNNKLIISFNNIVIGSLKLNKKYSLVHVEYFQDDKRFVWKYLRHRFSVL